MKKITITKPLIGILCIVILIVAVAAAVALDKRSPGSGLGIFSFDPSDWVGMEGLIGNESGQLKPPTDLPSAIKLPLAVDPLTGESKGLVLPCELPEYGLVIEKMAPYTGIYVEDGFNGSAQKVAMLMVYNNGSFPVEYNQICIEYEQEELYFDISALPVGERVLVQEKSGKSIPLGNAISATATVVQRANMEMSEKEIRVTDNGDNTLTIKNLTNETIPTVRVFYKYYMKKEDMFVGGIAFTVRIIRLGANASVTVQPAHYTSQNSRVVMALTYDSEV